MCTFPAPAALDLTALKPLSSQQLPDFHILPSMHGTCVGIFGTEVPFAGIGLNGTLFSSSSGGGLPGRPMTRESRTPVLFCGENCGVTRPGLREALLPPVGADDFSLRQNVSFHRLLKLLLARSSLQIYLRSQRIKLEEIPVRFSRRRARPAISNFSEVILSLTRPVGQFFRLCYVFRKLRRACRNIKQHPVRPRSRRSIRVLHNQSKGFGSRRRAAPGKLRRNIFSIAGELLWDCAAIGKTCTANREIHGLDRFGRGFTARLRTAATCQRDPATHKQNRFQPRHIFDSVSAAAAALNTLRW